MLLEIKKRVRAPPNITGAMIESHEFEIHEAPHFLTGGLFTTFRIVLRAPRDVCGKTLTERYIKELKYIIFAERDNNLIRLLSFYFFSRGVLRDVMFVFWAQSWNER